MKKLFLLAMAIGLLVSGCAYARIWQHEDSKILTTKEEIEKNLSQCEKNPEVEIAHKRANAWKIVQDSTVWIPYVGLGMSLTAGNIATTYQKCLIECMKKAGYRYQKKMSNKARWDVLSDFDISEEEWINPWQPPKEYNKKEEVISQGKEDKQEVMGFDRAPDSGLYYHRTDCTVGLKIYSRRYMTKEQAEKKGLRPCPICKP